MPVKGIDVSLEWYVDEIRKATNKRHLQNVRGCLRSLYNQGQITRRMFNGLNADIRWNIDRLQRLGA